MPKKPKTVVQPQQMSRGQRIRADQERRRIRNLYATAIAVGTLIVLVLAFAAVTTYIVRPNSQVAKVNNVTINRATYEKLRRYGIYNQIEQDALTASSGADTSGTSATNLAADQASLHNVGTEDPADAATVSQLVDNEVIRQGAQGDFQLNPSNDELKTYALTNFAPTPTPIPDTPTATSVVTTTLTLSATSTATGTATGTQPTQTPQATETPTTTPTLGSPTTTSTSTATLPPVPGASATAVTLYTQYIAALSGGPDPNTTNQFCAYGCPGINEQDYLSLVVEPQYLHDKVYDKLASQNIVTDVEQIHVQHILTTTQDGAIKIKQMLDAGADFGTVANLQSSEQLQNLANGTPQNGGDLGWTPKENGPFVQAFTDAAWTVPVGKYSDPVQTQFGWHIIKVLEHQASRPLSSDILTTQKDKLYNDWLTKHRDADNIEPKPTPTPLPATPAVSEPTSPPSSPAPAGSPAASGTITGTISTETATVPSVSTGTVTGSGTPLTGTTAATTGTGVATSTVSTASTTVASPTGAGPGGTATP